MSGVVVGVDGSAASERALAWAVEEAALRESTLAVVHSYEVPLVYPMWATPPPDGPMWGVPPPDEPLRDRLRQAAEKLAADMLSKVLASRPAAAGHVRTTSLAVEGPPAGALIEDAVGRSADLLVVGSHGAGALSRLMLGSVSNKVLHHAPCPVVVIPAGPDQALDG